MTTPGDRMRSLGIVQEGDASLATHARLVLLPDEAEDAKQIIKRLIFTMEQIRQVHTFAKGMGLAAPQIGVDRSVAVVRTLEDELITLINPRIIDESADTDEQYEGCLSFFDVRGIVPRSRTIQVEYQDIDGDIRIAEFKHGLARLIAHEVDHLFGLLYRSRMRPGVKPIPVSQYEGTGQAWV